MGSKGDSVVLYRIRKLLTELSSKQGRGTELVSLYIPPKKALYEAANNLRDEYGTAANIKSDTTRTHVQDALTRAMQRLKLYKSTPENGLVIFAGALPTDGPGSEVVSVYEIHPHKPVETYMYRCDDHFHLDPLREMLKEEDVIGILSIDATEAGLGIVVGEKFEVVDMVTSGVSGKHRAGGQSARRFERAREMELTAYFRRVAEHAKVFIDEYSVKGLIVGGPGPTKQDFLKDGYLDYRLEKKVLAVLDTSYAGAEGVRDSLEKAGDVLEGFRLTEEKRLVQRFLREVNDRAALTVYGVGEVEEALKKAKVETVLVSEDIELTRIRTVCKKCGAERVKVAARDRYIDEKQRLITAICSECGGGEYEVEEKDYIEYLADLSVEAGAKVEVISSKSEEGVMLKSFGGVAALLRYR